MYLHIFSNMSVQSMIQTVRLVADLEGIPYRYNVYYVNYKTVDPGARQDVRRDDGMSRLAQGRVNRCTADVAHLIDHFKIYRGASASP